METEGLSFPEAVERLAAEAGVDLPKATPDIERAIEIRRDLYDVLDLACRFFEGRLGSPAGQAAREYLNKRQISPSTQAEFRIGFAPDNRTGLLEHLRSKNIADEMIVRCGLAGVPENGGSLYDRFRGRIIFPIQDLSGRVVAFGGRAMVDGAGPKYLNSPETEVFQKGALVFNGHRVRSATKTGQSLAVVEGYVDAVIAYQAGHKAVVATLGTAFTEEQIKSLWRLDPEPVLCLDGDRAGRAAAYRAVDRMLPFLEVGKSFRFAFLPDGKDPDDLIRENGVDSFQKQLADGQKFWDVLWHRETIDVDVSNPDGIALLDRNIRKLVSQIGDTQLRYRYELTTRVSVSELAWRETQRRFRQPKGEISSLSLLRTSPLLTQGFSEGTALERIFLGLCVAFPDFVHSKMNEVERIVFKGKHRDLADESSAAYQIFANELCRLIHEEDMDKAEQIYSRINPVFFGVLKEVHGGSASTLWFGYTLAKNFPSYGYISDPAYFSRCFNMFLSMLMARQIQEHIKEVHDSSDIEDAERKMYLRAELLALLEWIRSEDAELVQIADEYRPKRRAA